MTDEFRRSIFNREGGHYNIFEMLDSERTVAMLRAWFPDGRADPMNFVLFSTSGIHGDETTLEELPSPRELAGCDGGVLNEVTFLLIQPRLVSLTYGTCRVATEADREFLMGLRASSWRVVQEIGAPE